MVDGRRLTRTAAITNVLQKSFKTYQVRWMETDYLGGAPQHPQHYTGLFEIELNGNDLLESKPITIRGDQWQ